MSAWAHSGFSSSSLFFFIFLSIKTTGFLTSEYDKIGRPTVQLTLDSLVPALVRVAVAHLAKDLLVVSWY